MAAVARALLIDLPAELADGRDGHIPLFRLEDVGVDLERQRPLHILELVVGGVDDEPGPHPPRAEQINRVDAVDSRHVDVDDRDVGPPLLRLRHQIGAVGDQRDDLDLGKLLLDQQPQRLALDLLVIRDNHGVL